jgi:two-component sensor histidine kinase
MQRDLMVAELSHRVNNTLATVLSISRQSFLGSRSTPQASEVFTARIRALAQTHSRLAEASWSGVALETIVLDELAPYRARSDRTLRISGPPVALRPKSALTLGLAIHELAANAVKYGAFSADGGSIEVVWQLVQDGPLQICWTESGGPPVARPQSSGFGRLLLERALVAELNGDVQLNFAENGLICIIAVPLHEAAA